MLRRKTDTADDAKDTREPFRVSSSDCHTTSDKGIAEERSSNDEADDNRRKDTEAGAKEAGDCRLGKDVSAAKDSGENGGVGGFQTYHGDAVGCGDDLPGEEDVVGGVGGDEADHDGGDGGVDGERQLTSWGRELG